MDDPFHGRPDKARIKANRGCCLPFSALGLVGSQLRIKDAATRTKDDMSFCLGPQRPKEQKPGDRIPDSVVFPTSIHLVEPEGDQSATTAYQMQLQKQLQGGKTASPTDSRSSAGPSNGSPHGQLGNGTWLIADDGTGTLDSQSGLEIDHQSVTSSAPGETIEEMEARVRREVELQLRQVRACRRPRIAPSCPPLPDRRAPRPLPPTSAPPSTSPPHVPTSPRSPRRLALSSQEMEASLRSQALQEAQELARQQKAEASQRDAQQEAARRVTAAQQQEEARTLAVAAEEEKRARVEAEAKAQQEAKLEALLSDADKASKDAVCRGDATLAPSTTHQQISRAA